MDSNKCLDIIGARFVHLVFAQREANIHIRSLRCEWRSKPDYCNGDPGYAGCAWEKKINIGPLLEDECCDHCWQSLGWRMQLRDAKIGMTKLKRSIR